MVWRSNLVLMRDCIAYLFQVLLKLVKIQSYQMILKVLVYLIIQNRNKLPRLSKSLVPLVHES